MDTSLTRAEKLHVLAGAVGEISGLRGFISKAWAVHILKLLDAAEQEKADAMGS